MIGIIALLAAAAAPTSGGTIYLNCTTTQPQAGPVQWQLALNETQGTVDVKSTANNGAGDGRVRASFSINTVSFLGFTLSRVDLTMSRQVSFGGMDLGIETGKCEVAKSPTRAF